MLFNPLLHAAPSALGSSGLVTWFIWFCCISAGRHLLRIEGAFMPSLQVLADRLKHILPADCAFRRWRPADPGHGDHLIRLRRPGGRRVPSSASHVSVFAVSVNDDIAVGARARRGVTATSQT